MLTGPQIYELYRLNRVNDLQQMIEFAKGRQHKGSTLLFPVVFEMSDCFVTVFPGDDYYPTTPNYCGDDVDVQKYAHLSSVDFRKMAKNLHRMERELYRPNFCLTIEPLNGHLKPLYEPFMANSKL